MCTPFRDYYMTLAVLNTIISTGLSCYSRYRPLPLRWDGEGPLRDLHGLREGAAQEAFGSLGLEQDPLRGHTACAVAQGPVIERAPQLAQCSAIAVPKFLTMFEQGDPTPALRTEPCK